MFSAEQIIWTAISNLTQFIKKYEIHLRKILEFYRKLKDTLKTSVSMKSKQEASLQITENDLKDLLKSFNIFMECLQNIYNFENNQGRYLESSIQNMANTVVNFFKSHNSCIDFSNNKYVVSTL